MLVDETNKVCYVCTERTGSNTIQSLMTDPYMTKGVRHCVCPEIITGYDNTWRLLTSIRHPAERLYSWCMAPRHQYEYCGYNVFWTDFQSFVQWLVDTKDIEFGNPHPKIESEVSKYIDGKLYSQPQSIARYYSLIEQSNRTLSDFTIIRYETFEAQVSAFFNVQTVPQLNESGSTYVASEHPGIDDLIQQWSPTEYSITGY